MARELPRIVRSRLDATVRGAEEPLLSHLRSQLVDIVRDCQAELYRAYKQSENEQNPEKHTESSSTLRTNEPETSDPLLFDPIAGVPDISAFYVPPFAPAEAWQLSESNWMGRTLDGNWNPSSDSGYGSLEFFGEMFREGTGMEDVLNDAIPAEKQSGVE